MDGFYEELAEVLEEDEIAAEVEMDDLEEWDSLGVLSVIAMIDSKFGVMISSEEIADVVTAGDLERLVREKKG
jgi:acyl carrier protein